VKFQERFLPAGKSPHVRGFGGLDTRPYERRAMGHRRNDEPSIFFEPDESTVKEVVNARRQQQPVLAI